MVIDSLFDVIQVFPGSPILNKRVAPKYNVKSLIWGNVLQNVALQNLDFWPFDIKFSKVIFCILYRYRVDVHSKNDLQLATLLGKVATDTPTADPDLQKFLSFRKLIRHETPQIFCLPLTVHKIKNVGGVDSWLYQVLLPPQNIYTVLVHV